MIREFTDREPARMTQAELHDYYGIPTGPEPERCECCFRPAETLVATLDGLLCVECVRLAAEEPEDMDRGATDARVMPQGGITASCLSASDGDDPVRQFDTTQGGRSIPAGYASDLLGAVGVDSLIGFLYLRGLDEFSQAVGALLEHLHDRHGNRLDAAAWRRHLARYQCELAIAFFKDQVWGANVAAALGIKSSAASAWCSGKLMKGIRKKLVTVALVEAKKA